MRAIADTLSSVDATPAFLSPCLRSQESPSTDGNLPLDSNWGVRA